MRGRYRSRGLCIFALEINPDILSNKIERNGKKIVNSKTVIIHLSREKLTKSPGTSS